MHTRSCVRLPGGIHASAAQFCLCTLDSASKTFLDILLVRMLKITGQFLFFFFPVTVVTKQEQEDMKRSRHASSKDPGILSEVLRIYCF